MDLSGGHLHPIRHNAACAGVVTSPRAASQAAPANRQETERDGLGPPKLADGDNHIEMKLLSIKSYVCELIARGEEAVQDGASLVTVWAENHLTCLEN